MFSVYYKEKTIININLTINIFMCSTINSDNSLSHSNTIIL